MWISANLLFPSGAIHQLGSDTHQQNLRLCLSKTALLQNQPFTPQTELQQGLSSMSRDQKGLSLFQMEGKDKNSSLLERMQGCRAACLIACLREADTKRIYSGLIKPPCIARVHVSAWQCHSKKLRVWNQSNWLVMFTFRHASNCEDAVQIRLWAHKKK